MTSDERPPARPRPRPASDSGADPVDLVPPTPAPAPAKASMRAPVVKPHEPAEVRDPMSGLTPGGAQGSFQLGVRVGEEYFDLVERVRADTQATKRKIIENALAYTYASYMKQGD